MLKMFIQYKTNASLMGLLEPNYNGYLSNFIKSNLPLNYAIDFPQFVESRLIPNYKQKKEEIPFNADYEITKPKYLIYESALLNHRYKTLRCDDPEIFKFAILMVITNIANRGSCLIAYNFCESLFDMIYLLKACFAVVNVYKTHLHCDTFVLKSKDTQRVVNFLKYAIDCPGEVFPFKNSDPKLLELFKALWMK